MTTALQTQGGRDADDLIRGAIRPETSPEAQAAWLEDAVGCLQANGAIIVRGAIPRAVIDAALADVRVRHDVHMAPGQTKLFRRFQSDPLRAQVPIAITGPLADPQLFAPPSILAIVRRMMGEALIVGEMGIVISHAGAAAQETHRDSDFLFGGLDAEIGLPPFSMTMLVPLLDVELGMGPTEFWPGSHRIRDEAEATARPPVRTALAAGDVSLHDSRTFHRGGANQTGPVRPAVYFSFHRPWYVENPGYEDKPQVRVTPAMLERLPAEHRSLFAWALHLNRTDSVQEFAYRWIGRIRQRVQRIQGR